MKRIFAFLSISIVTTFGASSPGKPAEKPADKPAEKPSEPGKIEVKNKSSFAMDAAGRNPFWPIGFKPPTKFSAGGDQGGADIPASAFVVSTITLDRGMRFAIINGKPMQEGQQFGLQLGTQTYQVRVKRIEDGRVILERHDQEIAVPLRRK